MDVHDTAATGAARCPMYDGSFAAGPQKVHGHLRAHGPAGPVELAPGVDATLVVGHETALRVLQNPSLFARDGRRWTALNDGAQHLRPRKAVRSHPGHPDGLGVRRAHRAPADRRPAAPARGARSRTRGPEAGQEALLEQFPQDLPCVTA